MRTSTLRILFGGVLLLACALIALWRWKAGELLRIELAERTARKEAVASAPAVSLSVPLPSDDEASAHVTRAEIERVRQQIAKLQADLAWPATLPAIPPPAAMVSTMRTLTSFNDVGHSTPSKTIQTLFWAASSGNPERIERLLYFDAETRAAAEALYAGLRSAGAAQHKSAEALLALLIAGDISFQASIVTEQKSSADEATVAVAYQRGEVIGGAQLHLRRTEDGWRLLVPVSAVKKYAGQLKGTSPSDPQ